MRYDIKKIIGRTLGAVVMAGAFILSAPPLMAQTPPTMADPESEEITAFASDITVEDDGRLFVRETIDYFFSTTRHGIYRDLPTTYTAEDGSLFRVPIDSITVEGDEFKVKRNANSLRIQIGHEDRLVSGAKRYVISYQVHGAIKYLEDRDQINWNVTGNDWTVPLRRVVAVVRLPAGAKILGKECWTGDVGSTASDCIYADQGNHADFASDKPLTVRVDFSKGAVAVLNPEPVSPWEGTAWYLLPLMAFGLMFGLWWKKGRDPKGRGTQVVQYDAPDKSGPGIVGVLMNGRADQKDVTAVLVSLAVRGYLKIREFEVKGIIMKSVDYELVKLKSLGDDAAPHEKKLFDTLFDGRDTVTVTALKKDYTLNAKMGAIRKAMVKDTIAAGYYKRNPQTVIGLYIGVGLALGIVMAVVAKSLQLSSHALYAGGAVGAVVMVFGFIMPRRTPAGVAAYEHAKGFREYLDKAEKYRLEWQGKEKIFEQFLPYAMMFGVAKKWAAAFEGMGQKQPDWYESRTPGVFSFVAFNQAMTSFNSSMMQAMASSPSSSSGSGGHSGGGFGGGGGGSW